MNRISRVYLLCVLSFCGVCFADDSFTVNVVSYGTSNSATIAVDINNSPVIVSHTADYEGISIITQTQAGYEANGVPDTNGGSWPRLKFTSNNELSLVYLKNLNYDDMSYELWYGSKGSWFDWTFSGIEGPPPPYFTLLRPDMDLTSNDIPHVVYYRSGGSQGSGIFHAFFDVHSGQWIKEKLIGFGSGTFSNLSIDIDPDSKIMVSASNTQGVKAAVYSDGFWNYLPSLEAGSNKISSGSFTADSLPAVAFERSGQLIYAVYINDIIGWVETVVASVVTPSSPYSIALAHSSTNVPAIVYVDNRSLMYATNVASGWTTTMIDEVVSGEGAKPYLIFDHNDKPLMVYDGYDEYADMHTLNIAGIGLEGFNIADLNNDKIVNFSDFAVLAEYWIDDTCCAPNWCKRTDFDHSGSVDMLDLATFARYWLESI